MSDASASSPNPTVPDESAALFASLVIQQANMATMLMGKVAHPESGKPIKDLEAAKLFIDHLEMLEAKTKGNLSREESGLLKQTLMSLRLAFVQAVETPNPEAGAKSESGPPPSPEASGGDEAKSAAPSEAAADESRKKFTKKY